MQIMHVLQMTYSKQTHTHMLLYTCTHECQGGVFGTERQVDVKCNIFTVSKMILKGM